MFPRISIFFVTSILIPSAAVFAGPLEPGDSFQDCTACPIMMVIPPGEYGMGGPPIDQGRPYAEGELRPVTIEKPFAVGKYEVTFEEWDECVRDGVCVKVEDQGWGRGKRPVISVSWGESVQYGKWLSKKTGKPYRLLTEAEWEYAARANGGRARFFGIPTEEICKYANLYDETAEAKLELGLDTIPCADGFEHTAPVGSYLPNNFGLYDMLGNVWEWTEDCHAKLWRNSPTDASARMDGDCMERAFRGGSWISHPPRYLQRQDRYKYLGGREVDLGFRVALSLDD